MRENVFDKNKNILEVLEMFINVKGASKSKYKVLQLFEKLSVKYKMSQLFQLNPTNKKFHIF